jgi:hypothetical protein
MQKRNVAELHKDIQRVGARRKLNSSIDYSNIEYLTDINTYEDLINIGSKFPLLSQRARYIKRCHFQSSEKSRDYFNTHSLNLERHLTRMYRIRNQLVHEAAILENIENITGNLRYYLIFTLNKCIDFFSDCQPKPVKDSKIIMNDFFLHQELVWENIKNNKWSFNELMKVPHSVTFIS